MTENDKGRLEMTGMTRDDWEYVGITMDDQG